MELENAVADIAISLKRIADVLERGENFRINVESRRQEMLQGLQGQGAFQRMQGGD